MGTDAKALQFYFILYKCIDFHIAPGVRGEDVDICVRVLVHYKH